MEIQSSTPYMIYFLMTIVSLLIGYWLGKSNNILDDSEEFIVNGVKVVRSKLKQTITPTIPTGEIKPKSANDIFMQNMSQEKKGAIEAMRETLNNSPELRVRKELVAAAKKDIRKHGIYE